MAADVGEDAHLAYGPPRPSGGDSNGYGGDGSVGGTEQAQPHQQQADDAAPLSSHGVSSSSSHRSGDRDKDRERDRDRHRDREHRDRDKDDRRERERDRERDRDRDRRDKDRSDRDRERRRSRSREREGRDRDRSSERKRTRSERSRSPKRDAAAAPAAAAAVAPKGPVVSLDKRPRRLILWDVPPLGCENMTPQQVKSLGIFPTPGTPSIPGHHGADYSARASAYAPPMSHVASILPPPQRLMLPLPTVLPLPDPNSATGHLARQAKRLYVGNIPFGATEADLLAFFNQTFLAANISSTPGNPVVLCTINHDKNFAFIEFRNADEATAALPHDNITYQGTALRLKRPKDYIAPSVLESPFRIQINGLPLYFNDDQVKELLGAFGELKFFVLNKDAHTEESKGTAICEYVDTSLTDLAVQGLNGMQIGEGTLQVFRLAQTPSYGSHLGAGEPTRVLQLLNMVTEQELVDDEEYEDICEDVKDECRKFGPVRSIVIPRPVKGVQVPGLGKVFVEFDNAQSCATAFSALAGRKFASRTVVTSFFNEDKYQQRNFE